MINFPIRQSSPRMMQAAPPTFQGGNSAISPMMGQMPQMPMPQQQQPEGPMDIGSLMMLAGAMQNGQNPGIGLGGGFGVGEGNNGPVAGPGAIGGYNIDGIMKNWR